MGHMIRAGCGAVVCLIVFPVFFCLSAVVLVFAGSLPVGRYVGIRLTGASKQYLSVVEMEVFTPVPRLFKQTDPKLVLVNDLEMAHREIEQLEPHVSRLLGIDVSGPASSSLLSYLAVLRNLKEQIPLSDAPLLQNVRSGLRLERLDVQINADQSSKISFRYIGPEPSAAKMVRLVIPDQLTNVRSWVAVADRALTISAQIGIDVEFADFDDKQSEFVLNRLRLLTDPAVNQALSLIKLNKIEFIGTTTQHQLALHHPQHLILSSNATPDGVVIWFVNNRNAATTRDPSRRD
jgi:hypothetical protein